MTKIMKGLCTENYKILFQDPNKWRDIACSWIGRLNIIEMSILPKHVSLDLKQSQALFFFYSESHILIAKTTLKKNNKLELNTWVQDL